MEVSFAIFLLVGTILVFGLLYLIIRRQSKQETLESKTFASSTATPSSDDDSHMKTTTSERPLDPRPTASFTQHSQIYMKSDMTPKSNNDMETTMEATSSERPLDPRPTASVTRLPSDITKMQSDTAPKSNNNSVSSNDSSLDSSDDMVFAIIVGSSVLIMAVILFVYDRM